MARRTLALTGLAAVALTATACTGGGGGSPSAQSSTAGSPVRITGSAAGGGVYGEIPSVVQDVEPSVVTIRTQIGLGSGVVYKGNGVIVTDAHVVEDQQKNPFKTVQVQFADGKQVKGTVVGVDNITDVAVVKVDRSHLPALKFSQQLPQVGSLDVVIGSPLGLTETVTAGIISGLHREIPPTQEAPQGLFDLIQTDAPISPGNSGGAVVNADRQVVGLSEAYIPPSQGAVAIGFATPSATVTSVADQLLNKGTVQHAFLGIEPADINPQVAKVYGLPSKGVLVRSVVHGSPADAAGLQTGDVITKLAGHDIANVTDLLGVLRDLKPGQQVKVTYTRGGKSTTATVTLGNRPRQ